MTLSPKTRLCVLGDSHIVALRRALQRSQVELETLDIKLIAAARDGMRHTRMNGTRLEAANDKVSGQFVRTSGGNPFVDLAEFDAIALCGLGISLQRLYFILNSHQPYGFQIGEHRTTHLMSLQAFQAVADDAIESSIAGWLIPQVRGVTSKPVLVIPQPAPVGLIQKHREKWPWIDQPGTSKLLNLLQKTLNNATQKLCRKFDAVAIFQPAETLSGDGFTKKEYHQIGNVDDAAHMNASYGAAVIKQLHDALKQA